MEEQVVHVLSGGAPLCGFSTDTPNMWPDNHVWVHVRDCEKATCPDCVSACANEAE